MVGYRYETVTFWFSNSGGPNYIVASFLFRVVRDFVVRISAKAQGGYMNVYLRATTA
jgi:hypothetical protein